MNTVLWVVLVMAVMTSGAWISEKQNHRFISYCISALAACLAIGLGVML